MKYWIFQNNQVLGPYEPDDMSKMSVFSPESLVCPEGRRGTSMGDWQRAGMVPDLSVALVRASSSTGGRTATLSIAGLPPEPTLKDLAQLGSLQEKVAMLEDVVLQLQEGLRAKDAELSAVHQELAGKSKESSELKSESDSLHRESEELKRQIAGLEERLVSVRTLSETLDKAVEEEKRVEQDVEKQGRSLADLTVEVENLRKALEERPVAPPPPLPSPAAELPPPFPAASAAPSPFAPAGDVPPPPPLPSSEPPGRMMPEAKPIGAQPIVDIDFPAVAPPAPLPSIEPPVPASLPVPEPVASVPPPQAAPLPSMDPVALPSDPMPGMGTPIPMPETGATGFDPMSFGGPVAVSAVIPGAPEEPAAAAGDMGSAAAPPKKSKALLGVVALVAIAALGGVAYIGGFVPGLQKPQAPADVVEPAPLPPPEPPAPPPPDPRQTAVDLAKEWKLGDGRTLGFALEQLAPPSGNLSPWMAEVLAGGRVQVNYFARGAAPGAPTIAYEFEVDTDAQTLVGRNAAAKSVLTGKAVAPPEPPKAKPVKVKPKKAVVEEPAVDEASLDSLLDEPGSGPAPSRKPSRAAKPKPSVREPADDILITEPGASAEPEPPAEEEEPRKPAAGKRAAKAKGKSEPADDAELLDDLLKE